MSVHLVKQTLRLRASRSDLTREYVRSSPRWGVVKSLAPYRRRTGGPGSYAKISVLLKQKTHFWGRKLKRRAMGHQVVLMSVVGRTAEKHLLALSFSGFDPERTSGESDRLDGDEYAPGMSAPKRPLPAQASPREKLSVRLAVRSNDRVFDYPCRDCVRAIIFHEWRRLVARDRLVAERRRHRPLSSYPGSARSALTVNRDNHRRHVMVRKADLGFLDRIRREVHVDVGAERRQVGFQSGTGEGRGARIRRRDFR